MATEHIDYIVQKVLFRFSFPFLYVLGLDAGVGLGWEEAFCGILVGGRVETSPRWALSPLGRYTLEKLRHINVYWLWGRRKCDHEPA